MIENEHTTEFMSYLGLWDWEMRDTPEMKANNEAFNEWLCCTHDLHEAGLNLEEIQNHPEFLRLKQKHYEAALALNVLTRSNFDIST
jgi:hypothetical protein